MSPHGEIAVPIAATLPKRNCLSIRNRRKRGSPTWRFVHFSLIGFPLTALCSGNMRPITFRSHSQPDFSASRHAQDALANHDLLFDDPRRSCQQIHRQYFGWHFPEPSSHARSEHSHRALALGREIGPIAGACDLAAPEPIAPAYMSWIARTPPHIRERDCRTVVLPFVIAMGSVGKD